jgi:CRISPR/Cas system CSM-associated protein Csm2 small subunit
MHSQPADNFIGN